jgi:hypothetical protein
LIDNEPELQMNADRARQVVTEAEEVPGEIQLVLAAAADNAGQTMIDQGRAQDRFLNGRDYSDEMIGLIIANLEGYLAYNEVSAETFAFFDERGVRA